MFNLRQTKILRDLWRDRGLDDDLRTNGRVRGLCAHEASFGWCSTASL